MSRIRGKGTPIRYRPTDVERAMAHYGVSREDAEEGLRTGKYSLPQRGKGLALGDGMHTAGQIATAVGVILATIGTIILLLKGGER